LPFSLRFDCPILTLVKFKYLKFITTNTITFTEFNGTFSYTIGLVGGYTASRISGTIDVDGENVNQTVTFARIE